MYGWIILAIFLAIGFFGFALAWALAMSEIQNVSVPVGEYGVVFSTDGIPLSKCGTQGNQPCTYLKNSLLACQEQCDLLVNVCAAFTYDQDASLMKIVAPTSGLFSSTKANLFIRQN